MESRFAAGRIFDWVYIHWFHGSDTNIEVGNFLSKAINIFADEKCNRKDLTTTICNRHRELCNQVEVRQARIDELDLQLRFKETAWNEERYTHFRFQPLFRAVFIIFEDPTDVPETCPVRIVKPGNEVGLSAPISFHNIQAVAIAPYDSSTNQIVTDFATAVDFMIALGRREVAADAVDQDLSVLDNQGGDINSRLRRDNYSFPTGPVTAPSTAWASDDFVKRMPDMPSETKAGVELLKYGSTEVKTVGDIRFRPTRGLEVEVYVKTYLS